MIRTPRPVAVATAVLGALLLAGCAARSVQIAQLQNRPDRYDGKTISITGTVTSISFGIPLVPFQLYKIDDGTGEITVVSRGGRAPSKGSRVQVSGKINEIAVFGGQSIGLHIEESDRRIRG